MATVNDQESKKLCGNGRYGSLSRLIVPEQGYAWGRTKQNKDKILHAGFSYTVHLRKDVPGFKHWRCMQYRHTNCKGKAKLMGDRSIVIYDYHNHPPSYDDPEF